MTKAKNQKCFQISHKMVNISERDTDRYMTLIHEICLEFDVKYNNEKIYRVSHSGDLDMIK